MFPAVVLILAAVHSISTSSEKICAEDFCKLAQSDISKSQLTNFCAGGDKKLNGRCCTSNDTLLATDLSNCNLNTFPTATDFSESSKYTVQFLAVNDNAMNVSQSDLRFFRHLDTLIAEPTVSCNNSFVHENVTSGVRICSTPRDGCTGVTCPSHSHCAGDGPGLNMCLCDDGWNSYRCLKKEGFPVVQWIAGFSVTTIVICVSLKVAQKKSIAKARASAQGS